MSAFRQILAGRDEPILEPEIAIVDAHHHLFDRPALRYMLDDYVADCKAGHRIIASVYSETQAFARIEGPEALRPLGEVEFANGVAAVAASGAYGDCRICAGIVGYADLRHGDAVAEYLDRALQIAPERFRGIRQIANDHASEAPFRYHTHRPPRGLLRDPRFRQGYRHLGARGLSFDAAAFHTQLPDVAALADAFPGTIVVLNHMGHTMAMEMSAAERADVFNAWRGFLRDLARRPNVVCKVGGLGLPFWGFGLEDREDVIGYQELAETWRPFVETAIESFGPGRCMMESNYPPDARSAGFVPLWNALKYIVRGASAEDKAALFAGTAARVYRVPLSA